MLHDEVKSGDTLLFAEADVGRQLDMHRGYYLHGRRKSPICDRYETQIGRLDGTEPRQIILFADRIEAGYELTMFGAYEAIDKKHKVADLLKGRVQGD